MHRHAGGNSASLEDRSRGTRQRPSSSSESEPPALQRLRHDLRQPLAAISWSVDAMNSTHDVPVHLTRMLDHIGRQARWMDRLLSEVLDEPFEVAVVDLADTVAGCCSTAPPGAPYELTFTRAGTVPVLVDPVGLERAARNLLDNASRAVAGGGRIEVTVSSSASGGVLEVADSGPGFGGLVPQQGHGLVVVRHFVERFGGDLEFGTSSLGGALVRLGLPRASGW
jgi:signal transduction histidine kinase